MPADTVKWTSQTPWSTNGPVAWHACRVERCSVWLISFQPYQYTLKTTGCTMRARFKGPTWAPYWPHEPCYLGIYWLVLRAHGQFIYNYISYVSMYSCMSLSVQAHHRRNNLAHLRPIVPITTHSRNHYNTSFDTAYESPKPNADQTPNYNGTLLWSIYILPSQCTMRSIKAWYSSSIDTYLGVI